MACDALDLFRWQQDHGTRRFSLVPRAVGWREHLRWFSARTPGPHWLLAEVDGAPVGTVAVETQADGRRFVSVVVAPERRGQRFGVRIIMAATHSWLAHFPLYATVHRDNVASWRAFERAGYVRVKESDPWLEYRVGGSRPSGASTSGSAG
jgi:RimJ/RimL family protein N-acetyltransferase